MFGVGGWLHLPTNLCLKSELHCGCFVTRRNFSILLHKTSVGLILISCNLSLYNRVEPKPPILCLNCIYLAWYTAFWKPGPFLIMSIFIEFLPCRCTWPVSSPEYLWNRYFKCTYTTSRSRPCEVITPAETEVITTALLSTVLTQPEMVEETTGLCGCSPYHI